MLNIITSILFLLPLNAAEIPNRVVSLSPAHTQTLIDLGLEDKIVCAAEPFNLLKTTKKIKSIGYYHKPSIELIISCKPDLIITTYAGTPPELYNKLKKAGYNIIVDYPKDLSSIKDFTLKLADIFKIKEPKVVKTLDSMCKKEAKLDGVMIIGLDPLIVAGKNSFVSDALKCAGVNNIISGLYPRISIETMLTYKSDIMVIAVKDYTNFKDYRLMSGSFKGKIIYVDPDRILLPSTRIIDGINDLKNKLQ